ncbi:MAG: XdhC family protein [Chloroflexi bacterium]|nr:XdhC family protein [Chloroflexota bacterium]
METLYRKLAEFLERGETVAVATIIEVKGSVPREVGAKMIIHPLGQHVGTVGGGCGEADVIRTALDVIRTGQPTTVTVDLTEDISLQSTGVCGGIMQVYVERWRSDEPPAARQIIDAILHSIEERESVALVTVTQAPPELAAVHGRHAVVWLDRPPLGDLGLGDREAQALSDAREALSQRQHRILRYPSPDGALELFVEVQHRPPRLIIVGAGHIAQPLAQLGSMCDFRVTVLDDRPQFARPDRFPTADEVMAAPLQETMRRWAQEGRLDPDTYIVLVTRGHQHDVDCLLEVLDAPVAYLGMIGSRRRVRAVFQLLSEEKGIPEEKFDRVYAPIGLDISAHTPAEIAVSIMAEIIKVRRGGGTGASLSERRRSSQQ